MANTFAGFQLTNLHRRQQLALRAATIRDVLTLWPMFDVDDIDGSWPAMETALLALIMERHRTSSGLASNYYRAYRLAEKTPGQAEPQIAPPPDRTLVSATLTILGPIFTKKAIAARRPRVAATALTRISGSVGRQVLEGGRTTMQQSIKADPQAKGWRRVTDGSPCDFCQMIADRGLIGDDVAFEAHDHCGCSQEPVMAVAPDAFANFLKTFETEVAERSASGVDSGLADRVENGFIYV